VSTPSEGRAGDGHEATTPAEVDVEYNGWGARDLPCLGSHPRTGYRRPPGEGYVARRAGDPIPGRGDRGRGCTPGAERGHRL